MITGPKNQDAISVVPHRPMFEDSAVFQMACRQLDRVAEVIDLDQGVLERLSQPKRALVVSVPIHMDDGRTESFIGYRVQHSLTSGPSKGGLRYHPSVHLGEVAALAMWMSWKCGIMNLPFGGGKGGIAVDPAKLSIGELERLTRRFTVEVLQVIGPRMDVMAPDLGTDEQTMAWIMDTYSMSVGYACPEIVTGKPVELGGCVGRREATGRGVVYCIMQAMQELGLDSGSSTAVIQGFGNVGSVVAQELALRGVRIIAVSDRYGAIANSKGFNVPALIAHAAAGKPVHDFPEAQKISPDEVLTTPCTIAVPAAVERVINSSNAAKLRCRILAEGANGPTTPEADRIFRERGIVVIPDIMANAGGVTVSYFEWAQDRMGYFWKEAEVNEKLEDFLLTNLRAIRTIANSRHATLRTAAYTLAIDRVVKASLLRGIYA